MRTCSVLFANELHDDERINKARSNHRMDGFDLILGADSDGYVVELCRLSVANSAMETNYEDIQDAAVAYEEYLNSEPVDNSDLEQRLADAEAALALLGVEPEDVSDSE